MMCIVIYFHHDFGRKFPIGNQKINVAEKFVMICRIVHFFEKCCQIDLWKHMISLRDDFSQGVKKALLIFCNQPFLRFIQKFQLHALWARFITIMPLPTHWALYNIAQFLLLVAGTAQRIATTFRTTNAAFHRQSSFRIPYINTVYSIPHLRQRRNA